MAKEDFDTIPVFYCKNCLSLKIRDVKRIENSEYCDNCGSTEVEQTTIKEWESIYKSRYGHNYLDNY